MSCDSNDDNGCETNVFTVSNCGGCGAPCAFPNAAASCPSGTCTMGTCSAGFADCTAAAGCETTLGTASNCASCGNTCSNAHGSTSCGGAPGSFDCAPVCSAGFSSCDSNPDNGCETDYNSVSMTLAQQVWSGNRAWSGIYYLLDAALPAATGTYTVHITGSQMGKVVNVLELRGIDQASPVLSVGGSAGGNCASDDPSDPITTAVDNALILTTVATFGTQVGTPSSLQTETFAGSDGSVGFKGGFLGPVAAGTRTITWDMASCNASSQALIALKPAAP